MAQQGTAIRDELEELGRRLHRNGEAVRKLTLDDDSSLKVMQELWREADCIRSRLLELHLLTKERYVDPCVLH